MLLLLFLKEKEQRGRGRENLLIIGRGKVFKKSFLFYNFNGYHDFQVTLTIVIMILIDVKYLV